MMMLGLMALVVSAALLQSCSDDDDDYYYDDNMPNAIVSVYTDTNGHPLLVLNDSTTLYPVNMKSELYGGKRMRAFVNLRSPKDTELGDGIMADGMENVFVNWIDTIRTKEMAQDMGAKNDSVYGTDPLEIVNDWATCVEDGFLTIRFRTLFGNGQTHVLNLVKGSTDTEVVIHQNANGDVRGMMGDGVIAFSLQNLGLAPGSTQQLTVKWNSYSGMKSHTFTYRVPK